jgi:hypothetical protein
MIVLEAASAAIDAVNKAYGKHKLCLGTALFLDQHQPTGRDIQPWWKSNLLAGETERQRLKIPRLAITV